MASAKYTEPASGSEMLTDTVGGADIFQYRETPFSAWADVDYRGVGAPGTAEAAASTRTVKGFWIVANPYNNNPIAIGPHASTKATASVAGFRGIPVFPGQAVWLPLTDPVLCYVDNLSGDEYAVVYPTHTDT